MNYTELAESAYKKVKHQSQWNIEDKKRIKKIEAVLQTEIEKELAQAGFGPAKMQTVALDLIDNIALKMPELKEEELIAHSGGNVVEPKIEKVPETSTEYVSDGPPQSLMSRIFAEQDMAVDPTPIKKEEVSKVVSEQKVDASLEKRFFVTIACNGLQSKPPFQIFKGGDIVEQNFRTDEITRHQYTYFIVVDGEKISDMIPQIKSYFVNAEVVTYIEYPIDWTPLQYSTIWQNRTKLK